jgi:uncharacterized SAM-binding protein YcdF (DUF218 family)
MSTLERARTILVRVLAAVGALAVLFVLWLASDVPMYVDRLVVEQGPPAKSQAIIVLCGGLTDHDLPVEDGWQRIYTAVQLHADGYAPLIVFSGGGDARVSEAEEYAEAARWLGVDPAVIRLDTASGSTAEHPANILKIKDTPLSRDSSLIIVTSELHTKRAAMCFRKAGYTNFRMVSAYVSKLRDPRVVRERRVSESPVFHRNGKRYDEPLLRLRWSADQFIYTLRELLAIAAYKFEGYA